MQNDQDYIKDFDAHAKVRIWEKIVDEQIHFNEIKSKNQTLFVSIITASIAAAGYLSAQPIGMNLIYIGADCCRMGIHTYTIPIIGAFIFTIAFYLLDVGVYHTFLKGAVESGKEYERTYLSKSLPSNRIEQHSTGDRTFGFIKGAYNKISWFYGIIGASLLTLTIVLNLN